VGAQVKETTNPDKPTQKDDVKKLPAAGVVTSHPMRGEQLEEEE
jgi:hypothetical protein